MNKSGLTGVNLTHVNMSICPHVPEPSHDIIMFQFVSWGVIGSMLVLGGCMGNILSIVVLSRQGIGTFTSIYLSALAIFDTILLLGFIFSFSLTTIWNVAGDSTYVTFVYPRIHRVVYPLMLIAQTCTIYIIVAFTIQRYIAIQWPLKRKICVSSVRIQALLVISSIVLGSIIYNIPRTIEHAIHECYSLQMRQVLLIIVSSAFGSDPTFRKVYHIYLFITIIFLIPFLILLIVNTLLWRVVRRSRKLQMQKASTVRENNVTVMLIAVVAMFLACHILPIADNFFMATLSDQTLQSDKYMKFTTISNLTVVLNSSINFILYCMFGGKFRQLFLQLFCCRKQLDRGSSSRWTKFSSLRRTVGTEHGGEEMKNLTIS